MLRNASAINGYAIAASDGRIGTVEDLLFDDASWQIRWLVVDTGNWLPGRKVLLPPSTLGHIDAMERQFSVGLTMQKVKDGPDIDTDRPVSRQMEINLFEYYGWSPYWSSGLYMGGYGYMGGAGVVMPPLGYRQREEQREERMSDLHRADDDPHLRSVKVVTGYHIHAQDGEIGHVEDFLVEDTDWSVHYLVVDTRNWWPGKRVLISPRSAKEIDWTDKLVYLDVDRQKVKASPAYSAATTVDQAFEDQFHDHYGAARSSDRPDQAPAR